MSAERDNPRGPTSEQLRRRVFAHETKTDAAILKHADDVERLVRRRCNACGAIEPKWCQANSSGWAWRPVSCIGSDLPMLSPHHPHA